MPHIPGKPYEGHGRKGILGLASKSEDQNPYASLSDDQLDYMLRQTQKKQSSIKSPKFPDFVAGYAQNLVKQGTDIYLSGHGGTDGGGWHGTQWMQGVDENTPLRTTRGVPLNPDWQWDTDLKPISKDNPNTAYDEDVKDADVWTDRGLVRLDAEQFGLGEDKWEYTDDVMMDFYDNKIVTMNQPIRSDYDSEDEYWIDEGEWYGQNQLQEEIIDYIGKTPGLGNIVTESIPTNRDTPNRITALMGGVDRGNSGDVFRSGIDLSKPLKTSRSGVKVYAGFGEKANTDLPLDIGRGVAKYCGDNQTCISAATSIYTMALNDMSNQYDKATDQYKSNIGYNNYLVDNGYEPFLGKMELFRNSKGMPVDAHIANKFAWKSMDRSPYWQLHQVDVAKDTEYDEDGQPRWKPGRDPGVGAIMGLIGEYGPRDPHLSSNVGHSGVSSQAGIGNSGNLTGKKDGPIKWYPGQIQDHTTGKSLSEDTPRRDKMSQMTYVGSQEYQDHLEEQMKIFEKKRAVHQGQISGIQSEIKKREGHTSSFLGKIFDFIQ